MPVGIRPLQLHIIDLKPQIRPHPRGLYRAQIIPNHLRVREAFREFHRPAPGAGSEVEHASRRGERGEEKRVVEEEEEDVVEEVEALLLGGVVGD